MLMNFYCYFYHYRYCFCHNNHYDYHYRYYYFSNILKRQMLNPKLRIRIFATVRSHLNKTFDSLLN